jgi:hypothetical protein
MRKIFTTLLLLFSIFQLAAQKQRTVNVYLQAQQNWTIYDITLGNNPNGFGLGAQAFLNTKSRFKATIELTGDIYMMDDKLMRTREISPGVWDENTEIPDVPGMVNLFAGASWHPSKTFYLGVTVGPSFIGGNTYLGFKPAVGFLTNNQRWMGKITFINIFNRDFPTQSDFGSAGISIGYRIH